MSAPLHEPTTATEIAACLARAAAEGYGLVPRGSGTKPGWNGTPSEGAALSTRGLTSSIEHYAGDLVATVPAGTTLAEANAVIGRARQWLPLDPTHADRATIGGIVATNDSGPRRHKYGSPRDLIIGVEVALADGRVAKAGGRVVKNVAGYDLARLLCGSHGSLGVITSATFKLAPAPPVSHTVVAQAPDLARAVALAQSLAAAPVTPSAIEIQAPAARLLVRFESTERAAAQMADAVCRLLEHGGATTARVSGNDEAEEWLRHDRLVWTPSACVVKISVLPTELASVFEALGRATHTAELRHDGDWAAVGRAALGVLLVRLGGSTVQQADAITSLRRLIAGRSGHVTVLEGLADVRARVAPTGDRGSLGELMRSVKRQFDPHGVLPAPPGVASLGP